MNDGGPAVASKLERVSLGAEMWNTSQKWSVQRSASLLAKVPARESFRSSEFSPDWLDAFICATH